MTYDQHMASDPRLSAWVSASAGTGKTKVLTDRVLRLLLDGARPDKILCITYTKAASAEMESRIEEQLGHWAVMPDGDLHPTLHGLTGKAPDAATLTHARQLFARVLDAPQRLRIHTIHGFCQSVLMRFPLEAGVAPHFTLIDERTSQELLREARLQLLHRSRGADDDVIARAMGALAALISEETLAELLEDIVNARRKFAPWLPVSAQGMRDAIRHALKVEPQSSAEGLLRRHFTYSPEEEKRLRRACDALLRATGKSDALLGNGLQRWLEERKDCDAYMETFLTDKGTPRVNLGTQSAWALWPDLKEVLKAEQQRVLAFARELQSLRVAEASLHMSAIAQELLTLYRRQKDLHGYMDYDDLITSAAGLLHTSGVASWVLYKLDGGIDHLLVDEAQDTSPEQWKLVEALVSEFFAGEGARRAQRTLFVVGDEKQSIFSFQGAEPLQFDAMQRRLSQRIEASGAAFKRVRLALSFRSTSAVLRAVDGVFAQEDARDGLVFTEQAIRHEVSRVGQAGRVEIWPLAQAQEAEANAPWHIAQQHHHTPSSPQLCAHAIADGIAQWLSEKRLLASQGRAVRAGDILILVQRRGEFARVLLRALKRRNVAVAGADRLILTEHIGVMDCMKLAEFLLLPQDDLTLATVLKSPFVGLSEEDVFALAYGRGEQSLWQRLKENATFAAAFDWLSDLLGKTDYLPPFELLSYALEAGGGRRKLAARLGPEVDDPLNEFMSLALEYGRMHVPSLQGFIHWLGGQTTQIKRDMEKGRDEVRIMTVHASKGLEAPIVFMADATRLPPAARSNRPLWTQGEPSVPLWSPFAAYDDAYYRSLREVYRVQGAQEYRRLLYVAMTRARDELYVCGWKGARAVSQDCWYELIRRGAESAGGWIAQEDKKALICEQTAAVAAKEAQQPSQGASALPGWACAPAPEESAPAKRTPSHSAGALSLRMDIRARERGILIHRLLQYVPEVAAGERKAAAARFMARYGKMFEAAEQEAMMQEVLAIIESGDFAPVFSAISVAEAPVCGVIRDAGGNAISVSGQIDRLAVVGSDVYIIDYKTSRAVPTHARQVPQGYLRQMQSYRQLVQQIYPDKTLRCALLWTAGPKLIELTPSTLDALAA